MTALTVRLRPMARPTAAITGRRTSDARARVRGSRMRAKKMAAPTQ